MRIIKKTLIKRHHKGMIYLRTILLKAASATFAPITMFKQQSLSFHIVSKTFITQNFLVFISSNILCFSCLCAFCLALFACFQARDNRGKHNFENEEIGGGGRGFLMTFANALARTKYYRGRFTILNKLIKFFYKMFC